MHAFDVLGDKVRRSILEILEQGEQPAGVIAARVHVLYGISQPAVSQHLKVLRDNGFLTVRIDGSRRLYSVDGGPMAEAHAWLDRFSGFWGPKLDALSTEIARGKRMRKQED